MDTNKKKLTLILEDGTEEEVEIIFSFEFSDTKKEYVIYTKNETDENGNITLYASTVTRGENGPTLSNIETDEEWSRIKDVLRELSSNNND